MKKPPYKVDWGKAPKIKGAVLIGHSFDSRGWAWFHYLNPRAGYFLSESEPYKDLKKPKGLRWQDSFIRAPEKGRKKV